MIFKNSNNNDKIILDKKDIKSFEKEVTIFLTLSSRNCPFVSGSNNAIQWINRYPVDVFLKRTAQSPGWRFIHRQLQTIGIKS